MRVREYGLFVMALGGALAQGAEAPIQRLVHPVEPKALTCRHKATTNAQQNAKAMNI